MHLIFYIAYLIVINVLLNSNASVSIKQKARQLMDYLEEPVFDSKLEQYTFQEVSKDLSLYQDCYVIWTGRVTNVNSNEKYFNADFLVGYEDMKKIDVFSFPRLAVSNLDSKVLKGKMFASDGVRMAYMSEAISALSDELKIFSKVRHNVSGLQAFIDFSKELETCDVSSDEILSLTEKMNPGLLKDKLYEINLINDAAIAGFNLVIASFKSKPAPIAIRAIGVKTAGCIAPCRFVFN